MQRTRSLHALFATLVAGCGPVLTVDDDDAGSSGSDTGTSATSATTAMTTGQTTDQTTVNDDGWDDGWDDGCSEPVHVDLFELPRSDLEEWLDDRGQIDPQHCWAACQAAGLWEDILGCAVLDEIDPHDDEPVPPEPGTTSGFDTDDAGSDGTVGSSGRGETGETGDEPWVLLECHWTYFCGGGRGHEALRPAPDRAEGDAVGRWAANTAHAEAGSVAAFLALRDELVAHDAPAALVARALEAAHDEVVHARMMTRIALRRGAVPAKPSFDRIEVRELEALAIENAVEGCVRETWAALEATFQARAAADPDIRGAMRRIASDETRHAELARDIDAWLRTRLDPEAVERVEAARDRAVAGLLATLERPLHPALLEHAGLPPNGAARRLAEGLREAMWS